MDKERLYEILDIENGSQFEYFENLADLLECEENIDNDILYELVKEINKETFAELCKNYFDEVIDTIPSDAIDIFTLLNNIKLSFIGMAKNCEDYSTLVHLADEIYRFRQWYNMGISVECQNISTGEIKALCVRDALILSRLEKLGEEEYSYNFNHALDYQIEEYIMSFADMVVEEETEGIEEDN